MSEYAPAVVIRPTPLFSASQMAPSGPTVIEDTAVVPVLVIGNMPVKVPAVDIRAITRLVALVTVRYRAPSGPVRIAPRVV